MNTPLRFGIIGCGVISPTHARSLAELPSAELVAVCDVVEEKARNLAAFYAGMRLEAGRPQVFREYTDLLAQPNVDIVIICTPSGMHAQMGIVAAKSGKNVIVEKPIDVNLKAAQALIDACHEAHVTLSVISQHRFDPPIQALRAAVDEGKLGQLNFGSAHTKWYRAQEYYDSGGWRGTWELDGGGALINQSIHYVDLLRYMMGPVEEISAYTAMRAHQRIEVEDIAVAAVKFKSGAVGFIEGNTAAYPGFVARLDIYGSDGSVIIENDRVSAWELRTGEKYTQQDAPTSFIGGTSSQNIWHYAHRSQLADIIDAVQNIRRPLVTGEDGYRALQLVLAVYESAREHHAVQVQ